MKVLKFGAVWCSGCLVMRSRWERLEKENPWLKTEYFDYDQDKEMVEKYQIKSGKLPVFIFLNEQGQEILRLQGEVSEERLIAVIKENKDK